MPHTRSPFPTFNISAILATVGVCLLAAAGVAQAQQPKTCIWTGNGDDNGWNTPGNWDACNGDVPKNFDSVVFLSGAKQGTNEDNIPELTTLDSIELIGQPGDGTPQNPLSRWTITGHLPLTVLGSLTAESLATNDDTSPSFQVPIKLGDNVLVSNTPFAINDTSVTLALGDIDLNGFTATFDLEFPIRVDGTISGAGGLLETGESILTLNDNSYTGITTIQQGTLLAANSHALGATGAANGTTINADANLALADGVTLDESISANGNIIVGPGFNATISGPITTAAPLNNVTFNTTFNIAGVLTVTGRMTSGAGSVTSLIGGGTLAMTSPQNAFSSIHLIDGTLDVSAADTTIGSLSGSVGTHIFLGNNPARTLTINQTSSGTFGGAIDGAGNIVKTGDERLGFGGPQSNTYTGTTTLQAGNMVLGKTPGNKSIVGPIIVSGGTLIWAADETVDDAADVTVNFPGSLSLSSHTETIGSLAGNGIAALDFGTLRIGANNKSTTFGGSMNGNAGPGGQSPDRIVKIGTGTLTLTGNNAPGFQTAVEAGTLLADGVIDGTTVFVRGGTFGGNAVIVDNAGPQALVSNLVATGGAISPGHSLGTIHADAVEVQQGGSLVIELNGTTAGTGYDQLDVKNSLTLQPGAQLVVKPGVSVPRGTTFTIVTMATGLTVNGTFNGLAEGGTLEADGQHFSITYHGGDGNDVVLTSLDNPQSITYYLSEGATGTFFDEDVLIANPNTDDAPVKLTFSKEDGSQVVDTRTVPAKSRMTVHVDQIAGLEATSGVSTQVTSQNGLPLVVERSMFWDNTRYAGSTGSSVDQPTSDWFFAEGSQGFFHTFVLINNPNATPTDVTFTFFRESQAPVVKTITVGATTRLTLDCGTVPEIVNSSFGIGVHATQPVMAERSIYFDGRGNGQLGGTESSGVTSTSTHWFLAEGATGGFFDTFILVSNPNNTPANVTFQYLLPGGDTVTVRKTVGANARLTTNVGGEDDARLQNTAVSTVVTSDVPVIAERSMYWPGPPKPLIEGHNSFGVVDAGLKWGLAEGRTGTPFSYHTYILLANPQTTAANVTVTFLRESGAAPVVKTFTVPATSRFNIDSASDDLKELHDETFATVIEVTNNVPIIVERSMYWDSNGVQFSGGTNATAIRLP
jgi:autotransporter-associated beta strand protein